MKYQSSNTILELRRRQRLNMAMLVGGFILVLGLIYGFTVIGKSIFRGGDESVEVVKNTPTTIERVRISRDAIPDSRIDAIGYGKSFDDLNDVQIEAAIANGISPELIKDPATNPNLVKISSCNDYWVDSMTHSSPYLVPDAALMLQYIAERFATILNEHGKNGDAYRLIVTSALRSQNDVNNLRRRNRNASENSCHRYGTTIDISYIRFLRDDGEIVNEEWLKRYLAEALYELRYEGICYVKHERRQACFHITLRGTNYEGSADSEVKHYASISGVKPIKKNKVKKIFNIKKHTTPQKHVSNNYVEY